MLTPRVIADASNGQVVAGDPRIQPLIDGAMDAVKAVCGWHVAPIVEETLVLDGTGGASLQLPSQHVIDVIRLKIEGEAVASNDFDWSPHGMLRLRSRAFPDRFRSVEVTLRHGYESAPAVDRVATQMILGALASPMGATREQAGGIAVTWARGGGGLTVDDRMMLAPYTLQHWG